MYDPHHKWYGNKLRPLFPEDGRTNERKKERRSMFLVFLMIDNTSNL